MNFPVRLFIIFFLAYFCTSHSLLSAKEREVRVGIFPFHPINFLDSNSKPAGIYVDILTQIANKEQWRIIYVPGSWDEGLSRVKRGELDLMTSIAYSKERDKLIDFSKESVVTVWGEVYIHPTTTVATILDLQGQQVAVMKGDISARNFMNLAMDFKVDCQYIELPSHHDVLKYVSDQKAIAGVVPNIYGINHHLEYGVVKSSIIFNPFSIYFGAPDGKNSDLLATIDRYLNTWKADKESPYYQTLDFWLGGEQPLKSVIPRWLLVSLTAVVGVALLFALWARILKSQVESRTRQLQESKEKYRGIFDSTNEAIFVHDALDGTIIDVNESMLKMFGYGYDEALKQSISNLSLGKSPYSQEEAMAYLQKALTGKPQLFEWTSKRKDGALFQCEVTLKSHYIGGRQLVTAVVRDITERKKLEEQLKQSQKMEAIGSLAGGIAHDFNNILSVIFGYSELAKNDSHDRQKLELDLDEIVKAANRAKELVGQILAISRKKDHAKEPYQIYHIVKEALRLLRASIPANIELKQNISSRSTVFADPTQIYQIVMNLCTNAYHAMRKTGGTMTVELKDVNFTCEQISADPELQEGNYVQLTVSDTGHGMDDEILQNIFDPYFTTKEVGEGTGLGLAVVHGIVETHNGCIKVNSVPGEGTSFQIYLPTVDEPAVCLSAKEENEAPTGGTEKILFVDDEKQIVDFAKKILSQNGYHVTSFTDSVRAIEEFQRDPRRFDLIITDMTMPRMTGADLVQQVMQIRPGIPVILFTGHSELINRDKALAMGIIEYCEKPVSVYRMLRVVRDVLDEAEKEHVQNAPA